MGEQPDRRNIYKMALDKWGPQSQIDMLVEECAELIVAVHHARRALGADGTMAAVIEELADVEIMLEQMRMIFPEEAIDGCKLAKVVRLRHRVEG
jgi:NTP pyrophosphatase (non-canonical NTP hydrolase)